MKKILRNIQNLINFQKGNKVFKSGMGVVVFTLFILSSLFVNQTVQALNKAAGNYGYYLGSYGYNASHTSSDQVPSAPTSLSCSASSTAAGTCSWTAPTTTTNSTSLDNLDHYLYNYGASSVTSCTSGTTASSASFSLSGLSQNTTYYVAVCAVDTNSNEGSVATSSFTTLSYSGGGTSGGTANNTITTPTPTTTTTPPATTTTVSVLTNSIVGDATQLTAQLGVTRDVAVEKVNQVKVQASVKEFGAKVSVADVTIATNFVAYGISTATINLGSGERLALVRDQLETLGRVSVTALEQIANGQKPTERNLAKENAQVTKVLNVFKKIANVTKPNFKDAKQDLAWNTMMYRIRFTRDLNKEKVGIVKFKQVFKYTPKSPLDWAAVRAYGYALK